MGTKTAEEKAREEFKQELLHASNWTLRHTGVNKAGASVDVMKAAEAEGPEAMIEVIMEKYDEGWRPGGAPLNPSSSKDKGKTRVAKKRSVEKTEPSPEESGEPETDEETEGPEDSSEDGEDDDDARVLAERLGLGDDIEEEPEPEPDPEPESEGDYEVSSLEEKVDQIFDVMTKVADVVLDINENVKNTLSITTSIKQTVVTHWELASRVWTTISLSGAAKPIKGYAKLYALAEKLGYRAVGKKPPKQK